MIRNEFYYKNKIALLKERDEVMNRAIIAKCYRALRRMGVKIDEQEKSGDS